MTSSIDFAPKLRMLSRSASVHSVSWPMVLTPCRLRQLYERTERSSSSMGVSSTLSLSSTAAAKMPSSEHGRRGLLDEEHHVLVDDAAGAGDGVARIDRAVRLDLEGELVVVGTLADTRVLDHVRAARHRAEQRIDRDDADRILRPLVAVGRDVAAIRRRCGCPSRASRPC